MLFTLVVSALLVPAITSSPITVAEILEGVLNKQSSQLPSHLITREELHNLPTHSLLEFAEKLKRYPAYDGLEFNEKLHFKEPYSYSDVIVEDQNSHPRAISTSDVIVDEQYDPVLPYTISNVVVEGQGLINPSYVIAEGEIIYQRPNGDPKTIVEEIYAPVRQYTTSNVILNEQFVPTMPISASNVIVEDQTVQQTPDIVIKEVYEPPPSPTKVIVLEDVSAPQIIVDENYALVQPYSTSNVIVNQQYVPTRPISASNVMVEDQIIHHRPISTPNVIVEEQIIQQRPNIVIEEVYEPPPSPTKVIVLEEVYTSPPPGYSASKILIEDLYKYIQKKFDFIIPAPEQTSFVAVKLVLNTLGEGLARGLDYDSAYNTVKQILKLGQLYPETAKDLMAQTENKQLNIQAAPIRNLINEVCGPVIENPEWCDQQIDIRVRSNPSYAATANILLKLGKMAKLFDAWIPEAEVVSAQHSEEEYLARSKCSLKPLIFALGEVFRASNSMP